MKMDQDVKVKWLEALRSGEYVQGNGLLRTEDDAFCCLGVLCDLAVKEGVIPEPDFSQGAYVYGGEDDGETAGLPLAVQEWSGGVGVLGGREFSDWSLSRLNDNGKPFTHIADIIEEEF